MQRSSNGELCAQQLRNSLSNTGTVAFYLLTLLSLFQCEHSKTLAPGGESNRTLRTQFIMKIISLLPNDIKVETTLTDAGPITTDQSVSIVSLSQQSAAHAHKAMRQEWHVKH